MTGANVSPCEKYRYGLFRVWDHMPGCVHFIGLNPSTADALKDDPTIRRMVGFARNWGYGGIHVTNLFAYRATDPKELRKVPDPVGPLNDYALEEMCARHPLTVCCWGAGGKYHNRAAIVLEMLTAELHCLRRTQGGYPAHPLYLPADTSAFVYQAAKED